MTMFKRNEIESSGATASSSQDVVPEAAPPARREAEYGKAVPSSSSRSSAESVSLSIISKALKITGQLESSENIQIDGNVEGDVRALSVKIGSGAVVKGSVYGESVELSGAVDGKIEAKKVVLTETARMSGDVIHQDIQINSGAFIDGHCRPEFGKGGEAKLHPLHAAASAREKEKETSKKSSNGQTKAELGAA
jgi:cytoskeletal protein CcmA (bactofilin family)